MKKRVLITSTDLMMVQFLIPHVINLSKHGFEIEIACSDVGGRMDEVRKKLESHVQKIHVVRLVRSPVSMTNLKGYRDLKKSFMPDIMILSGPTSRSWESRPDWQREKQEKMEQRYFIWYMDFIFIREHQSPIG